MPHHPFRIFHLNISSHLTTNQDQIFDNPHKHFRVSIREGRILYKEQFSGMTLGYGTSDAEGTLRTPDGIGWTSLVVALNLVWASEISLLSYC
jgi:hypothetical protein